MTKRVWESKALSIIVLPSGDQGNQILDLAQEWTRSWLLTPALWMLADEIPDFDENESIDDQTPPKLQAYLLGRDLEQKAVREQVDVFWTMGSQPFDKVRFIAIRTQQEDAAMQQTSNRAKKAARYIERSVPVVLENKQDELLSKPFRKLNLIIGPTNDRRFSEGIVDTFWDANLIAAAEDRSTPLSTDSFVKIEERFIGFALAHIATTAGLWAGLPDSSAEINSESTQLRQARLQRVFVRGVTSDALSADVAHWALKKLNYNDSKFEIGLTQGNSVTTIDADLQEQYMDELVEYIMEGPKVEGITDSFLYSPFQPSTFAARRVSILRKFLYRIQDIGIGLAALPRWFGAVAAYRFNHAIDDEYDEEILYRAIPKRAAPREILPAIDLLMESAKPKMQMPAPELWKHMRESISAAIDAPNDRHPSVLRLRKNDQFLVFSTIDQVLPDPEAFWSGKKFEEGTPSVPFEVVGWLDPGTLDEMVNAIQKRIEILEPGIIDARAQLSETQDLVDQARIERDMVIEDLGLIEAELESDELSASKVHQSHTHKLPRAITEKAPRASRVKKDSKKSTDTDSNTELLKSISAPKKRFWGRIFQRKTGK